MVKDEHITLTEAQKNSIYSQDSKHTNTNSLSVEKDSKIKTITLNSGKNYNKKPKTTKLYRKRNRNKKRAFLKALDLNGGNDEARTRDLMRDRHAL